MTAERVMFHTWHCDKYLSYWRHGYATSHVFWGIKLLRDDRYPYLKTPVGLSEVALIELDSETNRLEQDPCNCERFFTLSSPPCSLLLAFVAGFMSEGDSGPPGSLSALITGEQYATQCRMWWWHTSRRTDVTPILYVTYLHVTLHLLHRSPTPSDLLPLAIPHLRGVAYPDD